jgi:hypothetical protein
VSPPPRPTAERFEQLGFVRRGAHRWLAPDEVFRQQRREAQAEHVTAFTDRREVLAALDQAPPAPTFDLAGDEAWVDYLADTGDGFGATYSLAWLLAQDRLDVEGVPDALPAGSLLVLGGDETYPVASDHRYRDRIVGPLRAALPWAATPRALGAVPGNHDWYDGLDAFSRRFCQEGWIGGWRTGQRRSYFAARLPHDWWIWAIDIALSGLVDRPQVEYFEAMARLAVDEAAGREPRLVLCTPEPTWLDAPAGADAVEAHDAALSFVETHLAAGNGLRVAAVLTGDDHHYVRHRSDDGPVRIVCGGGGAFLHPTDHVPGRLDIPRPVAEGDTSRERSELVAVYPSAARSRRLRTRVVWFGFRNGAFPLVPAAVYLLWLLPLPGRLAGLAALALVLMSLVRHAGLAARVGFGLLHLGGHVAVMALAAWAIGRADVDGDAASWLRAGALAAAGLVLGPIVVGLYFVVVGHVAGINDNEAFSAIRVQDHKAFLRLHIEPGGDLVVHPVAVDRVLGHDEWRLRPGDDPGAPWFGPVEGSTLAPHLIEAPIRVR